MSVISQIEAKYKKPHIVDVRSGDTVRVHQKIKEGNKERVQVFEGLVIRTSKKNSVNNTITVRRIASGIGVEKTYLLHSPLVTKVEVVKRSKVRRNYLSYMRARTGKSARLSSVDFDQEAVNKVPDVEEKPVKKEESSQESEASKEEKETPAETKEEPKSEEKTEKPEPKQDKQKDEPKNDSSSTDK
jgi:large subunit ribosomal protein L19